MKLIESRVKKYVTFDVTRTLEGVKKNCGFMQKQKSKSRKNTQKGPKRPLKNVDYQKRIKN